MYLSVLSSRKIEDEEERRQCLGIGPVPLIHSVMIGHISGPRQQSSNVKPLTSVIHKVSLTEAADKSV